MSEVTQSLESIPDREVVDIILEKYDYRNEAIIMILQDIQGHFRFLPREILEYIGDKMQIPMSQIYGIATFYKAFSLKPKGRHHICVCQGTACHVKGAPLLLERFKCELRLSPGETSDDGEYSLDVVRCVGACSLAPVVFMGEEIHGNVTQQKLLRILKNKK